MLFGKKKKRGGTGTTTGAAPVAQDALPTEGDLIPADEALDFIAELIRIFGTQSFETRNRGPQEVEETFETWARHLLVGVPPPGRETPELEELDGERAQLDLPGLRLAFTDQRSTEQEYVTRSLADFRSAAWAFISGMRRSLTAEQSADRQLGHRMRRLESAVREGDPAQIKGEAQETVTLMTDFLADRGSRQRAQLREMSARLEGLREELDTVRKQAAIDAVTQVYNRASFDEQLEREIDLATLFGWRGCLILMDVDHFKWVNDNHGHPCGDQVLREVGDALTRCCLRRDDFVARYGGDEFVVLLRDVDLSIAQELAERTITTIRNHEIDYEGLEEPVRVTASVGIARMRTNESAKAWLERADRALYEAKEGGRDRIEVDPVDLDEP